MYSAKEAAEMTGLSTAALRYYEKEQLLPQISRTSQKYRQYSDSDIEWIKMVQCLRRANVPIQSVKKYIALLVQGGKTMEQRYGMVQDYIRDIQEQMDQLREGRMKTVLITGTTSGIGKAFAEKFADEGYDLILVARNEQKLKQQQAALQENYHVAVKYIVQDLTQESAAGLIMANIDKWKVTIDVLVNNAGFNECGFFVDTRLDRELEMINMHIRFVTELTKRILVHMKENGYGRILNVGSTGSFIPSPTDAVYSATKAYIMSFSNALCGELGKTGIKITTLCPGATKTEFAAKANIQNTLLFRIGVMKPEKVVGIAYHKMMKGRKLVIPGIYNKLLVVFSKVMPMSLINRITILMMK